METKGEGGKASWSYFHRSSGKNDSQVVGTALGDRDGGHGSLTHGPFLGWCLNAQSLQTPRMSHVPRNDS